MNDTNKAATKPPINAKLVSAYMGFIGRKGAAVSAHIPRNHFTTEHQQQAAAARWQKHNQQKDQLINESKQVKK